MVTSACNMCSSLKSCLKGCIIAINILVLLAGCAGFGTGVWIVLDEDSFFNTLYPDMVDLSTMDRVFLRHAAIVLASGGAATIFFSVLGIAAACTANACLLGLYILVITMVIAIEVGAIILGIVFRQMWERELDEEMMDKLKMTYGPADDKFTIAFNKLQSERQCCGWSNASDYSMATAWIDRTMTGGGIAVVPESCCKMENGTVMTADCQSQPTTNSTYMNQGCKDSLQELFLNYQGCIIGFGVSIAGLEFLLLFLAILLIANNDSNKYNMS